MRGDWSEWEWDETLFAGAAAYYERGRLPYTLGLEDALTAALALDGTGRLLDAGCGPGSITLRFARLFAEVVGLDPDAGMLREAERLAGERGIENATWVRTRAEDLPADLGQFRVVTFAASFHWMDRPRVARIVRQMLGPRGVVVHVDSRHQDQLAPATSHPAPPSAAIDRLRRAYLGADRRAGRSIRNSSPDDEASVFRGAGFTGPETVLVPDGRVVIRSVDDIVAEVFSMSSTAPHLFGDRLPQFETDLRAALNEAAPDGAFAVRLPDNELTIWRPEPPS